MTETLIDVRPILAEGGCPFDTVLEAAKKMEPGSSLTLKAPFNLVPLQSALAGIGIDYVEANQDEEGVFTVEFCFTPLSDKPLEQSFDLTDLEPPQPMVKIAETLAEALPGKTYAFETRFKPVHMLNSLDAETTLTMSDEKSDGTWITRILKREVVRCEH